jgi:hypothetical protein
VYTDLTGNAFQPVQTVGGDNRLLIDVPARSYAVFVQQTALPTELLDFTAKVTPDGAAVHLSWSTAREEDVAYHAVESSTDSGKTFLEIGRLVAKNAATNYQLVDRSQWTATERLYRLRSVDFDGSFSLSPLKQVTNTRTFLKVFPNPTGSLLQVQGATEGWSLFSINGQPLITDSFLHEVDLSHLPAGVYWLRSGQDVHRVVKR